MGRRKNVAPPADQLSIFDQIKNIEAQRYMGPQPGSFNISNQLRAELSEGLKQSMMSRFEVAAKMSELVGVEISKSQLDSWTAESKEYHRFPAEYLPAFCHVTGYVEPLRVMARMVQCYLLESKDALMAELGKIDQAKRELTKKEKAVRDLIERLSNTAI